MIATEEHQIQMKDAIVGAKFISLSDHGHNIHWEAPRKGGPFDLDVSGASVTASGASSYSDRRWQRELSTHLRRMGTGQIDPLLSLPKARSNVW
ncbi:hypothetical protein Q1M64_05910 (plasmid) [Sinorhizobium meliloti]|nr:hypothetical protein Q1M64_05910 [Sinorhizobium meliloti]